MKHWSSQRRMTVLARPSLAVPSLFERYGWVCHAIIVAITIYCIARV